MHRVNLFGLVLMLSLVLSACTKKTNLLDKAKEQGVASAVDEALTDLFNSINLGYLLANFESNRVHSVKHGKGLNIKVSNIKDKVKLYLEPQGKTIGIKQRLYYNNYIKPGKYNLYTSIGTKQYTINVSKDAHYDFFELAKLTETKANIGLGRIEIALEPEDAKIVIYGTPHKYRKGLRLPEGQYKVKVSKAGYKTQTQFLAVHKNKLTSASISLVTSNQKSEQVVKTSEQIANKKNTKLASDEPKQVQNSHQNTEEITLIGQLGELEISPIVEGVIYRITNEKNEHQGYVQGAAYATGTYSVTAIDSQNRLALATKQVTIKPLAISQLHFDSLVQKSIQKQQASVEIYRRSNKRERAVLILSSKADKNKIYRFSKRLRKRKEHFDITLPHGLYMATLESGGKRFELPEIALTRDSENKFKFELQ